jgi:hypothetical protein
MRKSVPVTIALCLLVALGLAAIGPAAAAPPTARAGDLPDFEGPVVSVDRGTQTFKISDHHAGIVRIGVDRSTRYEHLGGFGALRKGLRVDVEARRSNGRWIAVNVEREDDH